MHEPDPVTVAARASGEPDLRIVGVGPWAQEHPGEPRPDDPESPGFDPRIDSGLLDEGDRRNVVDRYRYWTVDAIRDDLVLALTQARREQGRLRGGAHAWVVFATAPEICSSHVHLIMSLSADDSL